MGIIKKDSISKLMLTQRPSACLPSERSVLTRLARIVYLFSSRMVVRETLNLSWTTFAPTLGFGNLQVQLQVVSIIWLTYYKADRQEAPLDKYNQE